MIWLYILLILWVAFVLSVLSVWVFDHYFEPWEREDARRR